MCGINGIINLNGSDVNSNDIQLMNDTLIHRGPDGEGVYVNNNIALGHRRLSIIDIAHHSDQPLYAADDQYVIVFNGEIYNYLEIKSKLISKGYSFKTESDTEVLLLSYIEYGKDCVNLLNGMFSFIIHDKKSNLIFIARDRLGIKPLFYTHDNERFIVSSEIKALKKIYKNNILNEKMIDVFLSSGYCYGSETLYEGIKKIEPGCGVVISGDQVDHYKYWDVDYTDETDLPEEQILTNIEELISDAMKIHLRSDVPLGVFLSGGLDSSAIVSLMNGLGIENINTFSVGWDLGPDFNEGDYARQISNQFNTQHYEYVMTENIFMETLDEYIYFMDEPVTEAAAISLYKLSELTSQHVKVVLSGEGADEVFGGYPIYKLFNYLDYYKKVPDVLRKNFLNPVLSKMDRRLAKFIRLSESKIENEYSGVSFGNHADIVDLYTDEYKHDFYYKEILKSYYNQVADLDTQKKMQFIDYKTWLVDDLLIKADRMTMAHSLELRVPLLDYRLIDYLAKVPSKYRLKNNQTKYLFKTIMSKYLPDNIVYRKKMGFPTPLKLMFSSRLGAQAKELILDGQMIGRKIFNKSALEKLYSEHESGKNDHHKLLWKIFILEKWIASNF